MKSSSARVLLALLVVPAFLPGTLAAQRPGTGTPAAPSRGVSNEAPVGTADLIITLRDSKQAEFLQTAKVTLRTRGGDLRGTTVAERGRAAFHSVALGDYEITVEAAGHPATRSPVSVRVGNQTTNLEVVVAAEDATAADPPAPTLTLREQKELTLGLRALQAQNIPEARKRFLSAAKTAPNHPDVDYLLGVVATLSGDNLAARQYFENAANRYHHVRSYTALGEMNLVEGNLAEARSDLERALRADPNCWRADQLFAAVALRQQAYAEAAQHAERALQLGKADAQGARLTLAEAYSAMANYDRSDRILNELMKHNPTEEQAREAGRILAANQAAVAPPSPAARATSAEYAPNAAILNISSLPLGPSLPMPSDNPLTQHPRWTPPNVDDGVPPADTSLSCPLDEIVHQAGKRVLELAGNLEKFTATERLRHQSLNEFGLAVRAEERNFEYLVMIREVKPGIFDVSEFRDGSDSREVFPEHVATLGTVALVFVFHPNYARDFDFQCEGRSHQGDQLAWQVRFQQKAGVPSRLRSYRLGTKYYRVGLKGRAWISADTSEVLRMESDLVNKVPDMKLNAEHQDITYGPVPFKKRDLTLWLPYSAETYLDFNGHRIHRRQDLTNYLLFWVDDQQHIDKPKETETPQTGDPSG